MHLAFSFVFSNVQKFHLFLYLLLFLFLAATRDLWDLSSLTSIKTRSTAVKACLNHCTSSEFPLVFFFLIFISWRLISLQYCSGFCHTLTWISHGFTCIPHPDPPSYLPLYPIPLALPSAPGPSTCLMHSTWAGDLFHPR